MASSRLVCQESCMFYQHPDSWPCEFYSYNQASRLCELNYCSFSEAPWNWDLDWETYVPQQKDQFNESFTFQGDHLVNSMYW